MQNYQKILVVSLLHIGDLLMITPALHTLRTNFPHAYITLLADANLADLVKYNPNIDQLITVDKKGYHNKLPNFIRLIGDIRKQHYDLVINLHHNERASAIAAFSGAKRIVGYAAWGFGAFFDHWIRTSRDLQDKNRRDVPHQAGGHLEVLKSTLGISRVDDQGLEMWLDEESRSKTDTMWRKGFAAWPANGTGVIGLNTGASWPSKCWLPSGFAQLADALLDRGYGVAFLGGPMDIENVHQIRHMMSHQESPAMAEFTGKMSLLELAALMKKCQVIVSNDSGPMHVAVSQKVPVVAIFGPSNEIRFGPYNCKNSLLTQPELPCRPCSLHSCPTQHECMTGITPQQVLAAVEQLL